jgi:hypothetical protein
MPRIGIVVNPSAGKDVRRIIGYASVVDNIEKIEILRRILVGILQFDVKELHFMPDVFDFADKTLDSLKKTDLENVASKVQVLPFEPIGEAADSTRAGAMMNAMGLDCIIVLGGDGTSKAVAAGCGKTPRLPISTGTNNVFPYRIDGTVAGLIAGAYATALGDVPGTLLEQNMFNVYINNRLVNHALVDVVLYHEPFISSRAMWEPEKVLFVAISRRIGEPVVGMASIAQAAMCRLRRGALGFACYVGTEDAKMRVLTPIAPGLVREIPIARCKGLVAGRRYRVNPDLPAKWCTVSVDGERENEVDMEKDVVEIELVEKAVRVLNPASIYSLVLKRGLLRKSGRKPS